MKRDTETRGEAPAELDLTPDGEYLFRFGPAGKGAPHSKKKICLVATDASFLASFLLDVSQRPDCHFVKLSTFARDGMRLGRIFMTSDEAAAHLCQQLKSHPKLFVSLQDDDFFASFRVP